MSSGSTVTHVCCQVDDKSVSVLPIGRRYSADADTLPPVVQLQAIHVEPLELNLLLHFPRKFPTSVVWLSAVAFISATICFADVLTAAITNAAIIGWIAATTWQMIPPIVDASILPLLPVDRVFIDFAGEVPFFTVDVVSSFLLSQTSPTSEAR